MATGAGLGGLVSVLLPLVGLVSILLGRKRGVAVPTDEAFEARQAATRESERRMAAYLAQQAPVKYQSPDEDEQEIRR